MFLRDSLSDMRLADMRLADMRLEMCPGDTVSIQLFPSGRHEGIVGRDGYIISRSLRYGGVVSLRPSVFADGQLRDNHGYIGLLTPDETVARAEAMLGDRGYDLLNNNCIHFVNQVNGLPLNARIGENAKRLVGLSDLVQWLRPPV